VIRLRVLLVLLVFLAACGGGDSVLGGGVPTSSSTDLSTSLSTETTATTMATLTAEEQAAADALAAAVAPPGAGEQQAADAQCAAEGLVAEFGLTRLAELGITPEAQGLDDPAVLGANMTAEEREVTVDVLFACVDGAALLSFLIPADVPEDEGRCFVDSIDTWVGERAVLAQLAGEEFDPTSDPAVLDNVTTAFLACIDYRAGIEEMARQQGASEELVGCVVAGLNDEIMASLVPSALAGEEPDPMESPEFVDLMTSCLEQYPQ
jgi:hypothetical protein